MRLSLSLEPVPLTHFAQVYRHAGHLIAACME
jgi:hypothetical protein